MIKSPRGHRTRQPSRGIALRASLGSKDPPRSSVVVFFGVRLRNELRNATHTEMVGPLTQAVEEQTIPGGAPHRASEPITLRSPDFPSGYWPKSSEPPDEKAWEKSVAAFRADLKKLAARIEDPNTDLLAPIPHANNQSLLNKTLLLADHNAYHVGQLVLVRRLLSSWP